MPYFRSRTFFRAESTGTSTRRERAAFRPRDCACRPCEPSEIRIERVVFASAVAEGRVGRLVRSPRAARGRRRELRLALRRLGLARFVGFEERALLLFGELRLTRRGVEIR